MIVRDGSTQSYRVFSKVTIIPQTIKPKVKKDTFIEGSPFGNFSGKELSTKKMFKKIEEF